jgi:hypothetical protein
MISDETPEGELVDALERRDPVDLKALDDIFSGNRKGIEYYYGQGGFDPSRDASYWAEALVKKHPDGVREYLNVRDTEFKPTELGMNAVTDHLEEEHGMDRRIIEDVNGDYYKLLVLVFHAMYDPAEGSLGREYDKMAAKTKIFKDNKEQVYYHDEPFDIDDVKDSVTEYVREQNDDAARGFAVKDYSDEDADEVVLKIFKESSRTGERVFRFRRQGREEPPAEPTIEYDSTHNVKTIGVRARNTEDGAEFTLSKGRSGWKGELEGFFESVFEIDDAWDTLEEERVTGATRVVQEVKETADDEEATERDVVDRATEVVGDLSEGVVEEMAEAEDVSDDEVEEAERLYESITLIGFEISQDEETGTAEFSIEAENEFEEWMNNIDEIEAGAKALLARAEQENLNLIYEASPDEGETERFTVSDGTWSPKGRGMDSDTIDHINRLLTANHDDG